MKHVPNRSLPWQLPSRGPDVVRHVKRRSNRNARPSSTVLPPFAKLCMVGRREAKVERAYILPVNPDRIGKISLTVTTTQKTITLNCWNLLIVSTIGYHPGQTTLFCYYVLWIVLCTTSSMLSIPKSLRLATALLLHLLYQLLRSESIGELEGESAKQWLVVICLSRARSWRIRWRQRRDGTRIQVQVCVFKLIRYFYFIYPFFRLQLCEQEPWSSWRGLTTTERGLGMSDNLNRVRLQVRKWRVIASDDRFFFVVFFLLY